MSTVFLSAVIILITISSTSITSPKVRENETLKITCETGFITTESASYGEPARSCHATGSLEIVSGACDNQKMCEIIANNRVFGDPCEGVWKYLTVTYTCSLSYSELITVDYRMGYGGPTY